MIVAEQSRRRARRAVVLSVAVALAGSSQLLARHASAQSSEATLAQSLFEDAKRLKAEKKYDQACPKFTESYRLDPAAGTLLNLAVCNEEWGKTATAWAQYKDSISQARKDRREDREKYASERVSVLEPKLSHLTMTTVAGAATAGMEIEIDHTKLGATILGSSLPVDPGPHRITVTQPGKKPWTTSIEIGAEADKKSIEIPALEDAPKEAPPPTTPTGPQRDYTPTYVVAGIGAGLVAIGIFTGIEATTTWSTRNSLCPGDQCTSTAGTSEDKTSRNWALATDVLLGVGAGFGLVSLYMYLVDPNAGESAPVTAAPATAKIDVHPSFAPGFSGLSVTGAF